MHKILLSTLIVLATFLLAASAHAQDTTEMLTNSIYRIKTGENGRVAWRECGERLTSAEALTRANEYAALFVAEHAADANFDPWIGASIAMAESSLNRCAISRGAMATFEGYLGRDATEEDILRLLQNRAYRTRAGVGTFDAGLVQFRWPGAIATLVGVTDAGVLIDAQTSIHMLAASMRHYRTTCDTTEEYRGTYTVNRRDGTFVRVLHYSIPCLEAYWVQHNSASRFNYHYYWSVMRWHRDLQRFSAVTPIVPGDTES